MARRRWRGGFAIRRRQDFAAAAAQTPVSLGRAFVLSFGFMQFQRRRTAPRQQIASGRIA